MCSYDANDNFMTDSDTPQPHGLLLTRDLFFSSKVTGTAAALGLRISVVGSVAMLAESASVEGCRCVLFDLECTGITAADVVSAMPTDNPPQLIGFGSHVLTALFEAAEAAGFDVLLSRGQFTADLARLLPEWCAA
jgi:hypothetical protein